MVQSVLRRRESVEGDKRSRKVIGTDNKTFSKFLELYTSYMGRILSGELNMRRIAAKFVFQLLTQNQHSGTVQVYTELQRRIRQVRVIVPSAAILTGSQQCQVNLENVILTSMGLSRRNSSYLVRQSIVFATAVF